MKTLTTKSPLAAEIRDFYAPLQESIPNLVYLCLNADEDGNYSHLEIDRFLELLEGIPDPSEHPLWDLTYAGSDCEAYAYILGMVCLSFEVNSFEDAQKFISIMNKSLVFHPDTDFSDYSGNLFREIGSENHNEILHLNNCLNAACAAFERAGVDVYDFCIQAAKNA